MKQILVVACIFLSALAFTQESSIIINFDAENPPYMYATKGVNGSVAQGVYPLLVRETFRRLKLPLIVNALPWRRSIAYVDLKGQGIGGLYTNVERRSKWDFSEPFYIETLVVASKSSISFEYKDLLSLRGKQVGVHSG